MRLGEWKSGDHVAHRSNSQVSRPRVAGEPTVWIAQKDHACYRREVPKRDDRSHANTLTVAPHICVVSRGTAQVLWRARLIVSLLGCKQECDELKVGGSHVEQHM